MSTHIFKDKQIGYLIRKQRIEMKDLPLDNTRKYAMLPPVK